MSAHKGTAQRHMKEARKTFGELLRNNRRMVVMLVAVVVFLWLAFEVFVGEAQSIDTAAYQFMVVYLRRDWLTPIMKSISELALPVVLVVMTLAIEAFAPGRRPGICAAVNLVCALALNLLLKQIVHRPRPEGFRLIAETGYSFPSGHSMIAMAFYGLLAWMVWHYEKDRFVRYLCVFGFTAVIVVVGASRVYLGVHYATDVMGGFCVSLAWLGFYTKVVAPLFLGDEKQGVEPVGIVQPK